MSLLLFFISACIRFTHDRKRQPYGNRYAALHNKTSYLQSPASRCLPDGEYVTGILGYQSDEHIFRVLFTPMARARAKSFEGVGRKNFADNVYNIYA